MTRSFWRLMMTVVAASALAGVASIGGSAQEAIVPHPSHIHPGTCAELDPNPEYPLSDVTAVSPEATLGTVEVGHSTIDVALDDLLASPYALNVHESAENAANYIACGNVAGPVVNGLLLIPLYEQNESGYSGIAALGVSDAGGTNVSVYIAPGLSDGAAGAATPVAMDATAEAATPAVTDTAAGDAVVSADEVMVSIADFAFEPQVLEIPAGTTVTWTNNDAAPHTATSNDGVWDSDVLNQGDSFSFTFDTAGTYDYICSIHPSMTGQIVVTEP